MGRRNLGVGTPVRSDVNHSINQMVYFVLEHNCWIKVQETLMNTYTNIKLVRTSCRLSPISLAFVITSDAAVNAKIFCVNIIM